MRTMVRIRKFLLCL